MRDPNIVFQEALSATGKAYLDAEQELRAAGPALASVLTTQRSQGDPIARLLASVLQQAAAGKANAQSAAIAVLYDIGSGMERRIVDTPSPQGLDRSLQDEFSGSMVELLALRLIKATDWPDWREAGVLLYINRHTARHPLVTVPLIRFAERTRDKELLSWAIVGLAKQPDDALLPPLRQEHARAAAAHLPWPPELVALETKRSFAASKGLPDLDALFHKALSSTGPAYHAAEQSLRSALIAGGDKLAPALANQRLQADPIAQLLAEVLKEATTGAGDEQLEATVYLEETVVDEAKHARPQTTPDPIGVAGYLDVTFADRRVEQLTLGLLKGSDWPVWRKTAVLLYLEMHSAGHPLITVPLIRFAEQTSDAKLRDLAIKGLAKQTDSELLAPLQREHARALAAKEPWPSELLVLEQARLAAANKPKSTP